MTSDTQTQQHRTGTDSRSGASSSSSSSSGSRSRTAGGYFDVPGGGLPRGEALGASGGLVVGLALSWAVYGAALSSAPVFALTVGVTLPMIVIGQRLAARRFDSALAFSIALVALAFTPALLG